MKRKTNRKAITSHLHKARRVHFTTPAVYPVLLAAAAVGALSLSSSPQTPAFAGETAALHPGRNPGFKAQMFMATFPKAVLATAAESGERLSGMKVRYDA